MRRALPLLAVLTALAVPTAASAATEDPTPTLSVLGQGTAFVTPDTADVSASVTKTATTAAAAREDVARRTNDLLAALARLGVPRADVTTSSVSIQRQMFRKRPKVRFTATVALSVHLSTAALAGPTLDALTAAGADDVVGPNFGFSNPSAGAAQAEQAALADARTRADAAAASVGLRVVGVRAIDLNPGSGGFPPSPMAAGKAGDSAESTPTPVQAGRQQVSATVAVVYVLG